MSCNTSPETNDNELLLLSTNRHRECYVIVTCEVFISVGERNNQAFVSISIL